MRIDDQQQLVFDLDETGSGDSTEGLLDAVVGFCNELGALLHVRRARNIAKVTARPKDIAQRAAS